MTGRQQHTTLKNCVDLMKSHVIMKSSHCYNLAKTGMEVCDNLSDRLSSMFKSQVYVLQCPNSRFYDFFLLNLTTTDSVQMLFVVHQIHFDLFTVFFRLLGNVPNFLKV